MSPFLIGIAGPSCSGKTTLAERVSRRLGGNRTTVLGMDRYYHDLTDMSVADRRRYNFDAPDALEHDLLVRHIRELSAGRAIDAPDYDYVTQSRRAAVRIEPAEFILVEGLFALYWQELREHFSLNVFVHARDGSCLTRRIARDVEDRGCTSAEVVEQYEDTVRPMREQYIDPTCDQADLVIDGGAHIDDSAHAILTHVFGVVRP